jgi:uncharacterized protein YndB with AHSA1/START domain
MSTVTARKVRDDELLIERTFDAPLELVFRLWENRDHMIRWWGPEQFTCLELDWEMKPGRAWRAKMVAKEWKVTGMGGVIQEVEKNKRIVFTFKWDDPDYKDDTVVTVTFAEKDGKTVQSFHQTPFSDVKVRDDHVGGWNSLFNKQQHYNENLAFAEKAGWRQ